MHIPIVSRLISQYEVVILAADLHTKHKLNLICASVAISVSTHMQIDKRKMHIANFVPLLNLSY